MVMSQMSCWVAAYVYLTFNNRNDATSISGSTILSVLGVLVGVWLVCTILFFSKINRTYWSTFYSWESGRQNAMAYFLGNDDDATKTILFTCNEDLWIDIRDEVKEWTLTNWSRWVESRPDWFTDAFKESVPDDMIPKIARDELNKK